MYKKGSGNVRNRVLILILIIILILSFGIIGFSYTNGDSFKQAFVKTIEILSFSHEGEILGTSKLIKILLSLFGVIFFWIALWESFDIAVESHFINNFGEARVMNKIKKLKNHYIICGGGRVGYHIAELLKNQNKKYVIIEKDEFTINQLRKKGFSVYEGDSLEEDTLKNTNIKYAKALITVLPESEKNVLVILTARELNKKLKIYSRSHKEEYIKKMKKAGADYVVTPEMSCAQEITKLCKI